MKSKIAQTIITGLVATALMTGIGLMAPYMGLPKMNPAEMLSGMMGASLIVGYLIHCMIGIIFAAVYVYLFNPNVHIQSKLVKGVLFGFAVFVFGQVMLFIIGKIMPTPQDNMILMMLGSLIGHLVFGVVVALMLPAYAVQAENYTRPSHV
ncbi:hypothetical protein BH09BAC2_BH09BAC2_20800 [soil metagenome]